MTGDMDVVHLTVLKGLSISQTSGFCHFCPVKVRQRLLNEKTTNDKILKCAKNKEFKYSLRMNASNSFIFLLIMWM